jgi:hypothetical protein
VCHRWLRSAAVGGGGGRGRVVVGGRMLDERGRLRPTSGWVLPAKRRKASHYAARGTNKLHLPLSASAAAVCRVRPAARAFSLHFTSFRSPRSQHRRRRRRRSRCWNPLFAAPLSAEFQQKEQTVCVSCLVRAPLMRPDADVVVAVAAC